MNQVKRKIVIAVCLVLLLACSACFLVTANRGIWVDPKPVQTVPEVATDVRAEEQAMTTKLRSAPWQGLRFLSSQREWGFYAVAGETRKIDLMVPFDLIKVYFLQADGDLTYTWAAAGVDIPGKGYTSAVTGSVQPGDLIEVAVSGDYVTQYGVEWDQCGSEYCHLAQRIDTILVLDDQGTGITNGFIRHGWEPPAYPMYGFLCWQIRPADAKQVVSDNASSK